MPIRDWGIIIGQLLVFCKTARFHKSSRGSAPNPGVYCFGFPGRQWKAAASSKKPPPRQTSQTDRVALRCSILFKSKSIFSMVKPFADYYNQFGTEKKINAYLSKLKSSVGSPLWLLLFPLSSLAFYVLIPLRGALKSCRLFAFFTMGFHGKTIWPATGVMSWSASRGLRINNSGYRVNSA